MTVWVVPCRTAVDLSERDGGLLVDERVVEPLLEQFRPDRPSGPRAFQRKFVNVQDPLLPTNNLGRSVSKYSFMRMQRALAHSALALRRALQLVRCRAAVPRHIVSENMVPGRVSVHDGMHRNVRPGLALAARSHQTTTPVVLSFHDCVAMFPSAVTVASGSCRSTGCARVRSRRKRQSRRCAHSSATRGARWRRRLRRRRRRRTPWRLSHSRRTWSCCRCPSLCLDAMPRPALAQSSLNLLLTPGNAPLFPCKCEEHDLSCRCHCLCFRVFIPRAAPCLTRSFRCRQTS